MSLCPYTSLPWQSRLLLPSSDFLCSIGPLFFLLSCDNISVDKYTRTLRPSQSVHPHSKQEATAQSGHLPQWIGLHFLLSLQWKWIEFSIRAKSSYLKLKSYSRNQTEPHHKIRAKAERRNMLTFERFFPLSLSLSHSVTRSLSFHITWNKHSTFYHLLYMLVLIYIP